MEENTFYLSYQVVFDLALLKGGVYLNKTDEAYAYLTADRLLRSYTKLKFNNSLHHFTGRKGVTALNAAAFSAPVYSSLFESSTPPTTDGAKLSQSNVKYDTWFIGAGAIAVWVLLLCLALRMWRNRKVRPDGAAMENNLEPVSFIEDMCPCLVRCCPGLCPPAEREMGAHAQAREARQLAELQAELSVRSRSGGSVAQSEPEEAAQADQCVELQQQVCRVVQIKPQPRDAQQQLPSTASTVASVRYSETNRVDSPTDIDSLTD